MMTETSQIDGMTSDCAVDPDTSSTMLLPAVVAVVVAHDPGDWFEEQLRSLLLQDYPGLVTLVVDSASSTPVASRVANILPDAYVIRVESNDGFGSAINVALSNVEGAQYLLICHDDIALEPDAVRRMVEESYRSNAGVVTPKMVQWEHPNILLHMGMMVDRCGVPTERIERDEIDHGQHDVPVEVFAAPGGCMLVRRDLMDEVGGMDPSIPAAGDDIDFSWRIRVAGGRVVLCPRAKVRHLEAMTAGMRPFEVDDIDLEVLRRRHELETVISSYDLFHLLLIIPQLVSLSIAEFVLSSIGGQHTRAKAISLSWRWVFTHISDLRGRRERIHAIRRADDAEIGRYQLKGFARIVSYARRASLYGISGAHLAKPPVERGSPNESWWASWRRKLFLFTWLPAIIIIVWGFRNLLLHHLPVVDELLPFPSWTAMLGAFFVGHSVSGFTAPVPVSPSSLVLGVLSFLTGGSSTLAQHLFLAVLLPIGVWGIWVATRPLGSRLARTVASLSYLFIPLAYGDISSGRVGDLVAIAGAPFIFAAVGNLFRAWEPGETPRTKGGEAGYAKGVIWPAGTHGSSWGRSLVSWLKMNVREALKVALVTAIFAMFVPGVFLFPVVSALGMACGYLFAREAHWRDRWLVNACIVSVLATVGAIALLAPWSVVSLARSGMSASSIVKFGANGTSGTFLGLLEFASGNLHPGLLPFGFLIVAFVAIFIVSIGKQLVGTASAWFTILFSVILAWLATRGWTGPVAIPSGVMLALGAVAICIAIGYSMDVLVAWFHLNSSRAKIKSIFALMLPVVMLVIAAVPVVGFSGSGRWGLPVNGYRSAAPSHAGNLHWRTLWLGNPAVLPTGGLPILPGLSYTVARGWLPDELDMASSTSGVSGAYSGSASGIGYDVNLAVNGGTATLGKMLSRYNIRYIVVLSSPAPIIPGIQEVSLQARVPGVVNGMRLQNDLSEIVGSEGYRVFVNTSSPYGRYHKQAFPWYMPMLAVVQIVLWALCVWAVVYLRRRRLMVASEES